MAHICMILRGDIRYDGRVRKEIGTLVRAGHQIDLVVSDFSSSGSGREDLEANVHYIPSTLWSNPVRNFSEHVSFNRKAASIVANLSPSHIHCHDLFSLPAGVWAKKETGVQLVYDAHELMPESMTGVRRGIWNSIEKRCLNAVDHIIMPEKNRIAYFKRKYVHIPEPLLLENLPMRADIPVEKLDLFRSMYPIKKKENIILYTGLIAPKRHVEELIDSMTISDETFVVVILGRAFKGYLESLSAKTRKLDIAQRVFFHEAVRYTEILRYMASCDIGTAFYRNSNVNNYYCASNKLYEYIGLDKPVITNNYPGLVEAVERFRQGICLKEITPESLAEGYFRAIDPHFVSPGSKKFFWEDQEHRLVELYER